MTPSAAIARVARSNDDLNEDDALTLAVDEVRAVFVAPAERGSASTCGS